MNVGLPDEHTEIAQLDSSEPQLSATELGLQIESQLRQVIFGASKTVRLVAAALLAGGHVLLEDRPGVGKTLLAKAVAASIGGTSARVQGSIDVLPSDITGSLILNNGGEDPFRFLPGPVFHNVLLIDELNRISPRAQAALLEAMEERAVTVNGIQRILPSPFMVFAAQNNASSTGTYPLLQGQIDRFMIGVTMGMPSAAEETALLLGERGTSALSTVQPVTTPHGLIRAQRETAALHVDPRIAGYLVALAAHSRSEMGPASGASPRASLMALSLAKALAVLDNRNYVGPEDIQNALFPAWAMRLHGDQSEAAAHRIIASYLVAVPTPQI
jgi:MoxR-like ATPase